MSQRWEPLTPRDHAVMGVLRAIQALSDAMDRMQSGMKGDMDMNATDIAALRMLIMREQRGQTVSPHDLAEHLRISTASTTKLLDRLTLSGHLERNVSARARDILQRISGILLTAIAVTLFASGGPRMVVETLNAIHSGK